MISELYRGQTGLVAYAAELRADFNRQREEDRRLFNSQMDDLKSFYQCRCSISLIGINKRYEI